MIDQQSALPGRWRVVRISDIHLGARASADWEAAAAIDSLDCDILEDVGDGWDWWKLRRSLLPYWPWSHWGFVEAIQRKIDQGSEVVEFGGNHNDEVRALIGQEIGVMDLVDMSFEAAGWAGRRWRRKYADIIRRLEERGRRGIKVVDDRVDVTGDGRRVLVLHGDQFDGIIQNAKWLAYLGDTAYSCALFANRWLNKAGRLVGLPYVPFSKYMKRAAKGAMQYVCSFEEAVAAEAKRRGVQVVIAGHIHHAEIRWIDGILYANCGDFVESRTLLAEDYEGNLWLLYFCSRRRRLVPKLYFEAKSGRILPPPVRRESVLVGV